MNKELTKSIIQHIFSNLCIIESEFVDNNKSKKILSKDFLLSQKLEFIEEDESIKNNIWGCQLTAESKQFSILVGDCSIDKDNTEYCVLVQLQDAPAYGLYLVLSDTHDQEPLIACNLGESWMVCSTYLQANFLAGMETIRDIGFSWKKANEIDSLYKMMLSFIAYHEELYGELDAGKEI